MLNWADFEAAAPTIARVGKSLLFTSGQGEVAILATADRSGAPHVAPVCPIFSGNGIYLSIATSTPKLSHLRTNPAFALHAQVGADDLEFQVRGRAREVTNDDERRALQRDIQFPNYDADHPIVELLITHALCVTWPDPGNSVKEHWAAD